jgi:flavin reductase (DIM6/NTAB) family NADH-FMN oxidoreductase RutF
MEGIDPGDLSPREVYGLMISTLVPRPIAWVSTVSAAGVPNLAPFSFFNGVSARPPIVSIAVGRTSEGDKDTTRNVRETKEFVVNMVDRTCAEAMVVSSGAYPPDANEFELAGVTAVPSEEVAPSRVGESPIHYECLAVDLIDRPGGSETTLILGRVLRFHVARRVQTGGRVDAGLLDPLARLGGPHYATLGEAFELPRPD